MGTFIAQKETSPLARCARNSLPHKSHRFCSPMRKHRKPYNWNHHCAKKETSPLARCARNSLPHKKPPLFVPQCENIGNHIIGTIIAQKRNFPSCSLRSQFTASQKATAFCSPMQKHRKPYN